MEIETEKLKPYEFNVQYFEVLKGSDYEALKKDIQARGIKVDLHILPDNTVICGNQRLKIAKELNLKEVPCKIVEGLETDDKIKEYVIKDNYLRRHLTQEQKAFLAGELYKIKFKGSGGDRREQTGQSVPFDVYAEVGKDLNVNRRTAVRYIQYAKICEEEPTKQGKKITQVLREVKQAKQEEEIKQLEPEKAIQGVFDVIVIDPPWKGTGAYDPDGFRGKGDYPTMEIEDIKKIKLPMAKNCIIWLWTIDLHLKDALDILDVWDLERKSTLIWVKDKIGLGHWLRNQHEYCFLAVQGNPKIFSNSTSSVLNAPRRKHSEKPDEFYKLVEKVCRGRKLDYFARKKREGWEVYGDEVKK
ncbi:MAG: ParB-like plasmid partitioning system protein (plasmid) [Candidatus Fermentimicrarchaeum limneticum]|uniref:ParB-like plasmid partitioning system protein n=1 Tax=Fermentimicrarchaeum limneticum TaxID=2795018 RepID=A0A7D5XFZ7_FERL1|nr:MAG: ParB-like plasmid partitioning system protein [Candidatus Fermentimicrarchaeum limneticum]